MKSHTQVRSHRSEPSRALPPRKPEVRVNPRGPSAREQLGSISARWLLSLAAVGVFVGFIVYLNAMPVSNPPVSREEMASEQAIPPKKKSEPKTGKESFTFYDELPRSQVQTPAVKEYTPKAPPKDVAYSLQTGSFRSADDAERQKAQIGFQGMQASVQKITLDSGSVWYRVNVGPFDSRSRMNAAIDRLVSINIQPLVRKVTKEG